MPAGSDPRFTERVGHLVAGVAILAVLTCAPLTGCGGGSSGADDQIATTTTSTFPVLRRGEGAVVLATSLYRFTVGSCVDGRDPHDTPQARQQFRLSGAGTVGSLPFTVEVTRYSSDTGVGGTTITDTALVTIGSGDATKGVEAKRSRVGRRWIDLAQPGAAVPLIVRSGATVQVKARFGPQGSQVGDPRIVDGRLAARCPA